MPRPRWEEQLGLQRWTESDHGLSPSTLNRAKSLLAEAGRASWDLGDLLVSAYGPPPPAHHPDGSHARMASLATELGCGVTTLIHSRITSAAWPLKHRRPLVAWRCHRHLASRPDRIDLLDAFCADCRREGVTPSAERLVGWLALTAPPSNRGRPRTAVLAALARAIERVEQEPTVDLDALAALVERLRLKLAVAA